MFGSDGAIFSAPIASDGWSSVREVQVPLAGSYVQIPPWAAPRIHRPVPGWMASAPMRPETACAPPLVRPICTIGFGPVDDHGPNGETVGWSRSFLACFAAADRSLPACSMVSGWSPATRRVS
jgi:hypothetical protein